MLLCEKWFGLHTNPFDTQHNFNHNYKRWPWWQDCATRISISIFGNIDGSEIHVWILLKCPRKLTDYKGFWIIIVHFFHLLASQDARIVQNSIIGNGYFLLCQCHRQSLRSAISQFQYNSLWKWILCTSTSLAAIHCIFPKSQSLRNAISTSFPFPNPSRRHHSF